MNAFVSVLIDLHNEGNPMTASPATLGYHAPTKDEFLSLIDQLDERRQTNALILMHMIAKESAEQMARTAAQFQAMPVDMLKGTLTMPMALRDARLPTPPADNRPRAATPYDTPPLLAVKDANQAPRKLSTDLHPVVYEVLEAHDTIQDFRAEAIERKAQREADLYKRAAALVEVALDLVKEAVQIDHEARKPTPPVDAKAAVLEANDVLSNAYFEMMESKTVDAAELERYRKAIQFLDRAHQVLKDTTASAPAAPTVIPSTLPELLTSMASRLHALELCTPEQIDEVTKLQVLADRAFALADKKPARKPAKPRTKNATNAQLSTKTA